MPSMHYMFFDDKKNIMQITDTSGDIQFESSIGDSMISFLELDLSHFNLCSNLIYNYIDGDNYDSIIEKEIIEMYPNTYSNFKGRIRTIEPPLGESILYFIEQNVDIENISDIYNHPYIQYSTTYQYGYVDDAIRYLDMEFNLAGIQQSYKELLSFCFDIEYNKYLNSLTAFERYYLFQIIKGTNYYNTPTLNYRQIILPNLNNTIDENIKKHDIDDTVVEYIKAIKPFQISALTCDTPRSLIVSELHNMLNLNIKMKKCKHCGQYFVLKGDYNTDYCDRILPGEKFTCKKLAAIKSRKEKIKSNPILKEYEKAYKRNYAKRTNKKINNEEFRLWVEEATQKRDSAIEQYELQPNDKIIIDFKEYLGNK